MLSCQCTGAAIISLLPLRSAVLNFSSNVTNVMFESTLRVLVASSASQPLLQLLITSARLYFREYVQRYTVHGRGARSRCSCLCSSLAPREPHPRVADVCSIVCFADLLAFFSAFSATSSPLAIAPANFQIVEKNRRAKFNYAHTRNTSFKSPTFSSSSLSLPVNSFRPPPSGSTSAFSARPRRGNDCARPPPRA